MVNKLKFIISDELFSGYYTLVDLDNVDNINDIILLLQI